MTAPAPTRRSTHGHAVGPGVTFAHVVRSEWIKLRSLRSTAWCFAVIAVIVVGFAALFASVASGFEGMEATPEQQQALGVQVITIGVAFAQLVAAVLGALVITGEYGTGMIRSTFTAVPRRTAALVAKVLIVGVGTFVVSGLALVVAALVTTPLLSSSTGIDLDLGDSGLWWSLVGAAASVAMIAMISFGLGAIIRNGAGGIAASIGLVFVLPIIFSIGMAVIAEPWIYTLYEFTPPQAATRVFEYQVEGSSMLTPPTVDDAVVLTPWQALAVLAGWVVALFVVAVAAVKRRDV